MASIYPASPAFPAQRLKPLRVLSNAEIAPDLFLLRFERDGRSFVPGQFLAVGLPGEAHRREYSIYSGDTDDFFEILFRRMPEGYLTLRLAELRPGDSVMAEGPEGNFTLPGVHQQPGLLKPAESAGELLLVATGTGISPFHCYARSYPYLSFRLLHGVRTNAERADPAEYGGNYVACVSQEAGGDYPGRVTAYLKERLQAQPLSPTTHCFLCGNCDMIYEVYALLHRHGISLDRLHTEVYF